MFNMMIAVGRLTDVPVLRQTTTGKFVANFTIALNSIPSRNMARHTDYFDVIVWNSPAENCAKFLKKGSLVLVQGRMQTRKYEAQDGTLRRVTELVAEQIQFLDKHNFRKSENKDEEELPLIEDEIYEEYGELPFID